jgi:hypothetical protein
VQFADIIDDAGKMHMSFGAKFAPQDDKRTHRFDFVGI